MLIREGQFFPASYDTATKVISAAVCAIPVVVLLATRNIAGVAVSALAAGIAYAWSPRGYRVAEQSIFVKRLIGEACIPLRGLREARATTPDDFKWCIRVFGVGGLFGYYGVFRTSKLGTSHWYLTSRSRAVVVITLNKTSLVSPDDQEGFLAAIQAAVPTGSLNDSI